MILFKHYNNKESGILIVELIIAMGIFLAIAGSLAMLATRSYISHYQASDNLVVQNIINDKYSELKKIKQEDFSNLSNNTTSENFSINGRIFTRTTTISSVYRDDVSNKIVESSCVGVGGCTDDPNTKRAEITVSWNLIQKQSADSQTAVVYFTKWENQ
jgi:Tfp pilus assembly protein PilV